MYKGVMYLVPGADCVLQSSELQHLLVTTLLEIPKLTEPLIQRSVQNFMMISFTTELPGKKRKKRREQMLVDLTNSETKGHIYGFI